MSEIDESKSPLYLHMMKNSKKKIIIIITIITRVKIEKIIKTQLLTKKLVNKILFETMQINNLNCI